MLLAKAAIVTHLGNVSLKTGNQNLKGSGHISLQNDITIAKLPNEISGTNTDYNKWSKTSNYSSLIWYENSLFLESS